MRDQIDETEEERQEEVVTARRGRPTLYGEALTPAQRAARYRKRKQQRLVAAIDNLAEASDARLLELLYYHLVGEGGHGVPQRVVGSV